MNIYAAATGIIVALLSILLFRRNNRFEQKALYAYYLVSFPLYYWLFAFYDGTIIVLFKEITVSLLFFILAGICLRMKSTSWPLLLGFAYLLHAAYDISHSVWFYNPGAPLWWAEFCAIIDIMLGFYIYSFTFTKRPVSTVSDFSGESS